MKLFLLTYLFLLTCINANCQDKTVFEELSKKYSNNSIVGVSFKKNIEIFIEEGKIKIYEKIKDETMLLKDDFRSFDNQAIYSNSFVKTKNIKSFTFIPKGNSYKSFKNENIEIQKDNSSSSFYDDQKKHIIHYEKLEKGVIRILEYEKSYEYPHFFGQDYLCDYYPIENREINIKCSKKINLEIKFFNDSNYINKLIVSEDSKFKYYNLKLINIPEFNNFKGSPGLQCYLPHVVYYIKSYELGEERKELLNNVANLFNWYTSLIKHLPAITNKQLLAITDSLTDQKFTEIEKVENIFYWVQKNIKYVAFEDGMGGFVPREASSVFQKKYGDCKDMAFLIYSMLKYKNIDGFLTWIGTRSIPYSFSQVPTPLSDNHMIACYKKTDGSYIFLDATDKQIKFGFPSSFTQGKQGLIATQTQFIDTSYVPIMPYYKNVTIDSSYVKIQDDILVGKCINYFTGYNRVNFINDVTYLSNQTKDEYFKNEYEKGNNKFFISNLKEKFDYNDTTAVLKFDFQIKDYVKKLNNEIYINLNIEKNTETYKLDNKFDTPYEINEKKILKFVKILEIPTNYIVDYIPEDFTKKGELYELKISYKIINSKIIHTVEIIFNTLLIPIKEISKWNEFTDEYKNQTKKNIVLKVK